MIGKFAVLVSLFVILCRCSGSQSSGMKLLDLQTIDTGNLVHSESIRISSREDALEISFGTDNPMPGITLPAPEGKWNLTGRLYVSFSVENKSDKDIMVICRLNGEQWVTGGNLIHAGKIETVKTIIPQNGGIPEYLSKALFGMNGMPGNIVKTISREFDVRKVSKLVIQFPNPEAEYSLVLSSFNAEPGVKFFTEKELAEGFFPFVDEFGQYRHKEWEGKIHSVDDLKASAGKEDAEMNAKSGPADWDTYGGWNAGPALKATGHFRTEKYNGKWWLVDPEGKLFWSHGIDEVYAMGSTPITDREHYFEGLPSREKYPDLYSDRDSAPFGYYHGKSATIFNMAAYNLIRKYGDSWEEPYIDRTHRRLRSWGMNTMGAWTRESMYLKRRTPYTIYFGSQGRVIEGSEGHWRKFPDPFDEGWRQKFAGRLKEEKNKSAADPYCIGYFLDNELTWGNDTFLAESALKSPADQPVKLAFRDHLRKKYRTTSALNKAWDTGFTSWDAFLVSTAVPENIGEDLREFTAQIGRRYLSVCRDEIIKAAPDKLYMGARWDFHLYPYEDTSGVWILRLAGEYCDVITFNRYRYTCAELVPPEGIDKPVMITEWHIGTLDRGMFHFGLRAAMNLEHQNMFYQYYVRQALRNPCIVGTHWFLYGEQAVSGRTDGENFRIGFVDICDQPYRELVDASREIGYNMYKIRSE